MPRLVLINGAPGSGKSTLAHLLAQDEATTLALDVDALKYALGCWERDPTTAGLRAQTRFIDQLAAHLATDFVEIVLILDPSAWPADSPKGALARIGPSTR